MSKASRRRHRHSPVNEPSVSAPAAATAVVENEEEIRQVDAFVGNGDDAAQALTNEIPAAAEIVGALPPAEALPADPPSLVQRLVAARRARGWSRAEAASRLRLPLHVVQAIENEDHARIGEGVYLRAYLSSYARLLGVPAAFVESAVAARHAPPPELVATGGISRSRYLIDRYSSSAIYVVLTAVLVMPVAWMAFSAGNGGSGARLTSLDAPLAPVAAGASPEADASAPPAESAPPPPHKDDAPLMASFVPMPAQQATKSNPVPAVPAGSGEIRLSFAEPSWVEIVDSDGKRLEYAMLPAGTQKTYVSGKPLTVLLGNAEGARVELDGRPLDFSPYRHANVARFVLLAPGRPIAPADNPPRG